MIAEDQSEVIAFLENPATWGDSAGEVVRIDTHGAAVFLVGERAYKMKRAVRFPYMDFSTLERRRTACEAEFAINRRTAPTIYQGVVAVTREPAGLALGGLGVPVEWLVVMWRFDQGCLFDRMAKDGRLRPEHIEALAEEAAAFHEIAERHRDGGGAANIARAIDFNRDGFAAAAGILEPHAARALVTECRDALAKQARLLEARRADGFVRRCHGDLHLRNVCLIENRPTLFDAIEFNDDLAVIDVLYDIAFLIMDLVRDSRTDLASRALNRYLETSDDYGGLAA
ncbi:MAG TPA: phosphotransferase, partial [Alphaproteobacteria bacterium]|nr:phosphotransferase [Alphaproteobacteria bacterium]